MSLTTEVPFTFPSNGSLWIPLPVKAIKHLANTGFRPASRVLYAICLHLGKDLVAVFPSYETISWYACVGENSIRQSLNKLVKEGYISIEKVRKGRKFENHYTVLQKAWNPNSPVELSRPGPTLNRNKEWICPICWDDVKPGEETYYRGRTWEGAPDNHWIHAPCSFNGHMAILEATPHLRQVQVQNKDIIRQMALLNNS